MNSLGAHLFGMLVITCSQGCTQLSQSEIKFLETRELDLPYDEAYQAAANGLFSLGFTIEHSDKESGILTGRVHDPRTGLKIMNTVFFGLLGLAATTSADHSITFMLNPVESNMTQLRMQVVKNGKQIVDRKLMTRIWQQVEREAMLETKPVGPDPKKDSEDHTVAVVDTDEQ